MKRNCHLKYVNITKHIDSSENRPIITLGQSIRSVRENGVPFDGVDDLVFDDTDAEGVDPLSNPRSDRWDLLENGADAEYEKRMTAQSNPTPAPQTDPVVTE